MIKIDTLNLLFFIIIGFLLSPSLNAQEAPFSKGVNLTSWFQTGSPKEIQLKKYDQKDFDQIKSLGCDVVRLPVNLIGMTNGAPNYSIDPLFFTFLDSALLWAEQSDIHLILDNHTFDPAENTSEDIGDFLNKVWPQIAYRYRDSYDKFYYEILNEPHGINDAIWNSIQQSVINKIRQVDNKHFLIIGPAGWNSYNNLSFMPEYDDPKLIYTFHFYDPFLFTHQGASWVDPSMVPLAGVPFPYDASNMPAMPANFAGTWLQSSYNNYPQEGNAQHIKDLIDIAVEFKITRNVPLFCGEFGVYHDLVKNESERNNWYGIVSQYLEENGISWTTWDYHGAFGIYEKNSQGLFDHDLNIPLLEALGLNIPDQTEFIIKPDSSGIVIYDDFIGKNITASNSPGGPLSMYEEESPQEGNFFMRWENPNQYNFVGFDFSPNRDLSLLTSHDFTLDFWFKCTQPNSQLDLRFVDSKTGVDNDRPWRIRYILDNTNVNMDGTWQKVSIPLIDFVEHGSWDENTWFEPIGAFDWSDIDRFEIVDEYGATKPVAFSFDKIEIKGSPLKVEKSEALSDISVFPNPAKDHFTIQINDSNKWYYTLFNINGKAQLNGEIWKIKDISTMQLKAGSYFLELTNGKKAQQVIKLLIN